MQEKTTTRVTAKCKNCDFKIDSQYNIILKKSEAHVKSNKNHKVVIQRKSQKIMWDEN
jgi:hypothetical protein